MSPLGDDYYVIVYVNIIYHNLKTTRLGSSNNILWIRHTGDILLLAATNRL